MFFQLTETNGLPEALRESAPSVVWLEGVERDESAAVGKDVALRGRLNGGGRERVLIRRSGSELTPHFDVARSIEATLLETYYDGLVPTLEMKLPFNYSLLPSWLKSLGRAVKGKAPASLPVEFPPGSFEAPQFAVDWLREVATATGQARDGRSLRAGFPEGKTSALTITYDVDTDFFLRHERWIERFCDLEDEHGLRGAYYCVPMYCRSRAARDGIKRLQSRGREIGCHGFNHDAKWPLLKGRAFDKRLDAVRGFAEEWGVSGFRSEWLWRTPRFLEALAKVFAYDSSVPTMLAAYSYPSRNGCSTAYPYRTHGDLVELPLTVAMDEWRHLKGLSPAAHFEEILAGARRIFARGGLVTLALHPQQHQAANEATFSALASTLKKLEGLPNVHRTTPTALASWVSTCAR